MSPLIDSARTFLFVPGDRPERFSKASAAGADVLIVDLEDAVSPANKDAARRNAQAWLEAGNSAIIRVNAVGTQWHNDDVWMSSALGASVMLPKAEHTDTVCVVAKQVGDADLILLIETAIGINVGVQLASVHGVSRLAFGSVDYATQLGVDPTNREALQYARSALVVASAAAGLASPVDGVTTAVLDLDAVEDDVRYARGMGLQAKLCIHPAQLAAVHRALAPTLEQITWAHRVLTAAENSSVATVDGEMVDAPVARRARQILARRDEYESR